jgi:hypothetical protein
MKLEISSPIPCIWKNIVPIIEVHPTIPLMGGWETAIGRAVLKSFDECGAIYDIDVPIEGRGISGGWKRNDSNQLELVELALYII